MVGQNIVTWSLEEAAIGGFFRSVQKVRIPVFDRGIFIAFLDLSHLLPFF